MLIDKPSASADETIVLFPRSYNKRGDERLHSVQGVTLDGREVNIKLRVDEAMQGKENTPSIAEFSREDVKAKNPCLAAPDNGPGAREGVLLFSGCEDDGENKKGILSFTARWGYVLASHSDAPEPVFGLGRVVMIADSHAAKTIHAEITELERSRIEGWEALSEHKRKQLSDPMLFSYYGQLYIHEKEALFDPKDKDLLIAFAREAFATYTRNGIVGGLLIRLQDAEGNLVSGFSPEVFPRWKPGNTYQTADDVLGYFFRSNARQMTPGVCAKVLVMPIMRYSCGPSFKNYYFLKKPEESLLRLRKRFLINNEPTVSDIAFALSRREDSGEFFMAKYYPMGNPISSVADIGKAPVIEASPAGNIDGGMVIDPSVRLPVGLSEVSSLMLPSWYSLGSLSGFDRVAESVEATDPLLSVPMGVDLPSTERVQRNIDPALELEVEAEPTRVPMAPSPSIEQLPTEPALLQTDTALSSQPSPASGADSVDGDLSDLFADISDDELEKIEETQLIALEERARADRLLAQQEAEEEARVAAQAAALELEQTASAIGPLAPAKSEHDQSYTNPAFRLVDDSAAVDVPMTPQKAPSVPQPAVYETSPAVTPVAPPVAPAEVVEPELTSLEKELKRRGLL